MENEIIDYATTSSAKSPSAGDGTGRRWHAPVLSIFEMACAQGDPTISDDGLGDGLFS